MGEKYKPISSLELLALDKNILGVMGVLYSLTDNAILAHREIEDKAWKRSGELGVIMGKMAEEDCQDPKKTLVREAYEEWQLTPNDYVLEPESPFSLLYQSSSLPNDLPNGIVVVYKGVCLTNRLHGQSRGPRDGETDSPVVLPRSYLNRFATRRGVLQVITLLEQGVTGGVVFKFAPNDEQEVHKPKFNEIAIADKNGNLVGNHTTKWSSYKFNGYR
ncbi:hypothetical protein HY468_02990 [Candidatus Roizmanbacteria bacterium]|nr:hypothetical protein [Candidatus Roizmanbacteria bacterium]